MSLKIGIEDVIESIEFKEGVTTIQLYAQNRGVEKITFNGPTKLEQGDTIRYYVEEKKTTTFNGNDPSYAGGRKDFFTGLVPLKTITQPLNKVEEAWKILKMVNGEVIDKYGHG